MFVSAETNRSGRKVSGATVEAVFQLPVSSGAWRAALADHAVDLDEEGTLVLARETHAAGRSVSRLNGRAMPVGTIREVGGLLVDIHGQGTHLSLLDPRAQLALLDGYAGLDGSRDALAEIEDIGKEKL